MNKVVFSVLLQLAFTGVFPSLTNLLGMAIIIAAGTWTEVNLLYGYHGSRLILEQMKGSPKPKPDVIEDSALLGEEEEGVGLLEDPQHSPTAAGTGT